MLLCAVPVVLGHKGATLFETPWQVIPQRDRRPLRPSVPEADRSDQGKVFLEHADTLRYKEQPVNPFTGETPEQYQVLVGKVQFRKGGMHMYCDSAYFYETSESFDAFGNVKMEQGDTLFVYGDQLLYDGATGLATLYADAGRKVRLINRDVTLTTDIFNYDMEQEVGYYNTGGTLSDKSNTLVSREGEYYPSTKYAYFYRHVELESDGREDTLRMFTDSLVYNTETHVAQIIDRTRIVNADGTIYSTSGFYNTETGVADLYSRSTVVMKRGNTLTGDTLTYDRTLGFGEAFGNMLFTDSARQSSIGGDYGYYNELTDSAFVTGRAIAKEYSRGDTLYLHGDTINSYTDIDSIRVMNVFHKVRFFRSDMQGLCDSLSYWQGDSIMYMYRHPVVWSDTRQIYGNVIYLHLNDSVIDWIRLPDFAFTAEHLAEDCYNQMTGADMTVWFEDNKMRRLYIDGNLQMNLFPLENDSTVNKMVFLESTYLDGYFKNNTLESGRIWPDNNGTVTPLYLARKNAYYLDKFEWYEDLRPNTPGDVFVIPQRMIDLINSAPPVEQRKRVSREDARTHPDAPDEPSDSIATPGLRSGRDLLNADAPAITQEPGAPEQPQEPEAQDTPAAVLTGEPDTVDTDE